MTYIRRKPRKVIKHDIIATHTICPLCNKEYCQRHSFGKRLVYGLYNNYAIRVSKHYCSKCLKYFSLDSEKFPKNKRYDSEVINEICKLAKEGHTLLWIKYYLESTYNLCVPVSTLHDCNRRSLNGDKH